MYTIGQVSEMFALPISTLRYYDKEGLFPQMERSSGIRRFSERELEALRVIECLKRSGLEIKEIKQFKCSGARRGAAHPRSAMRCSSTSWSVKAEMDRLEKTLGMLRFQVLVLSIEMADGSEDTLHEMIPDKLPPEIKAIYDNTHSD